DLSASLRALDDREVTGPQEPSGISGRLFLRHVRGADSPRAPQACTLRRLRASRSTTQSTQQATQSRVVASTSKPPIGCPPPGMQLASQPHALQERASIGSPTSALNCRSTGNPAAHGAVLLYEWKTQTCTPTGTFSRQAPCGPLTPVFVDLHAVKVCVNVIGGVAVTSPPWG